MNKRQRRAITRFASSIRELKDAGVIRSHRYLGDLAEFLCADAFSINLEDNLRQAGHDGTRGGLRVQIKYGGGTKTNVDLGDPLTYDEVYVVLGEESVIRSYSHDADFLVYKLTAEQVRGLGKTKKGKYSYGANQFRRAPDRTISLDEPVTSGSAPEGEKPKGTPPVSKGRSQGGKPSGMKRK
jgi:hypothetical protein